MSDQLQNRIKLAEAMGWVLKDAETHSFVDSSKKNYRKQWHRPDGITHSTIKLPDPENDANDDYAVLEWLRKHKNLTERQTFEAIYAIHEGNMSLHYQIGDYARAALKVICDRAK